MFVIISLTLTKIKIAYSMSDSSIQLTNKKIFYFWIPLAATWLMMSIEGSYIAALIARMPEPKFNLAAYGVAFSFALIIEAPIIMMMSASIALVKDNQSFHKLRNFTYAANGLITLLMLILVIPQVFYFITEDLIGLPSEVSRLTHIATTILIPWPGAIGYRRFYQGILIRNNLTRLVAYGTVIRLITMTGTALFLFLFTNVDGVVVGSSALSLAVVFEAIASRLMANRIVKEIKAGDNIKDETLGYKEIYKFYYPLALTSVIGMGVQPVVTFFVGQSRMAIESLAILPVVTSFVFIFRGLGLSFQEVVIALSGETAENFKSIKQFAIILAAVLTTVLSVVAFTPLADFWFKTISGLSDSLSETAKIPLMIMAIFPSLTVLVSTQRGLLVATKETKPLTIGIAVEFTGIIIVLAICINLFSLIGAIAASVAYVLGRIAANIYLISPSAKILKQKQKK